MPPRTIKEVGWSAPRMTAARQRNGFAHALNMAMGTGTRMAVTLTDGEVLEGWITEKQADIPIPKDSKGKGEHSNLRYKVVNNLGEDWFALQSATNVGPTL
jgi:TusA-related sulfurtransferase